MTWYFFQALDLENLIDKKVSVKFLPRLYYFKRILEIYDSGLGLPFFKNWIQGWF